MIESEKASKYLFVPEKEISSPKDVVDLARLNLEMKYAKELKVNNHKGVMLYESRLIQLEGGEMPEMDIKENARSAVFRELDRSDLPSDKKIKLFCRALDLIDKNYPPNKHR